MNKKNKFRSSNWYNSKSHRRDTFIHRGWMRNQGHPNHLFDGRPVIGICNTWSELTPCNGHFREIAESVKKGVYEAGGFPLEFPVFSASESNLRPTAMLFRNLASMDVEEAIRGNPIDGVVLLMGCDKTTPSLMMGAASVDLPTIGVSGGPMLNGHHQGETIGSGTGVWKLDADLNAGVITEEDFINAEISMSRSKGNCMTMGTASTMGSMVEALGMSLPGNAAIPAVDSRRYALAHMSGKRIVEMVKDNITMSSIVTKKSFENAIKVNGAIGGSTNAVIHLAAIAGRMEIDLDLEDKITFRSGISEKEIVKTYHDSDIAVIPSLYEGFGFGAGEAMACGVPLISTDSGGLKQVIGDAALKIKPGSVNEIEEGILKLFTEEEIRQELAEKGRERMEEFFDWKIAASAYIEVFKKII